MNKQHIFKSLSLLILTLAGLFFSGCGGTKEKKESLIIRKLSKVTSPKNGSKVVINESINFQISVSQDTVKIDSFFVKIGTELLYNSNQNSLASSSFSKTGKHHLSYTVFLNNGSKEVHSQQLSFLSDVEPTKYSYRKINTYTHDPDAYIQGLFYENGYFYESTGHRGESSLRKVEIATGNVLQKIDLDEEFFGEGITPYKNQIFMLTWESRKGFVFDKNDFSEVRQFNYPTEGWGITTIGDSLVMSDGTENLYFIDPSSFTEIGRIQVYNQAKSIEGLNELEYINGDIYANIYQTDNIAIIDPTSGKVKGIINLAGIFNKENYGRRSEVLNGIAYDPEGDRLFVTGKFWPKMYEIDLVPFQEPTI
ncbi:glutaminyl-peptide cyclotransferase [Reichenbachiella sp. MALMAid0571]|uniref:glutaminyl-peptide cyclotransferase n=1 Tax=Reichenbachiella sp. MALMAid0571 TaxID=3143939 RepID=UPI0032DF969B